MRRIFVALPLPENIRGILATAQTGLPNIRWVRPENLHITLVFLGGINEPALEDAHSALCTIQSDAFSISIEGIGQFGDGKPRAVWAGIKPSEPVVTLQEKVETSLHRAGIELKARKFHPHVTLARVRSVPPARIGQYLEYHGLLSTPEFAVNQFHMMESLLKPAGPLYLALAGYYLD